MLRLLSYYYGANPTKLNKFKIIHKIRKVYLKL